MSVAATLLRLWQQMILWFAAILLVVQVGAVAAISLAGPVRFSFWLVVAGAAAKYWPLVAGILLVSLHLRTFVANGVTRHEFLRGLVLFAAGIALVFPAVVVVGHAVESVVLGLFDHRAASYPVFHFGEAAAEYLHLLPATVGFLTTGILISAGFYRFRPWIGVLLIAPGALPGLAGEGLIEVSDSGELIARLPYAIALTLTAVAVVLGAVATHRLLRDVAIKRSAT
ncbi:hypothetical protein M1L60_15395 [Actinoplanes sp. TRM 88003]|uniref:Uncharacterized protein n=1 Tax=Paractinoplanes aksuensis TaxID=2939490 RepID=A0ABT1DME6_9ACTN|nr:hypothetical protein [Actinoplanes aksuensis]MCO8271979.1 hypothetical protein [Actinoplanes aksuensis]